MVFNFQSVIPSDERFSFYKDHVDLVIERPCLVFILKSVVIDRAGVVNGMVSGNITRAMNDEHVGTFIYRQ